MPYFISESHPGCKSGWAVIDDANEIYGCHDTKQSAIDQAVAISINDEEPFEGERAAIDSLAIGDYVSWDVLNPTILAEVVAVEGQMAVVRIYENEDGIFTSTDKLMIINVFKIEKINRPEMVAEEFEEEDQPVEPMEEDRAVNQEAPAYMRAAARRGLEYYADGLGGDGLVERTIREAREMAEGTVSDDKWVRIAAWIARHLDDLDSPDANPSSENYPSAGVVAHLLWGSGPSKRQAQRALEYAEGVVARIRTEEESDRMEVMDEARAKWLKAAYAIKAKIEGTPAEGRSLGKGEIRTNHIELRAEGDGRTFTGYASVFNEPSQPLPFIEYVKPGAFKRSLSSRNRMMLLWNHDTSNPLASTRNGSLSLVEDNRGLKVTATLPDTTLGRDVAELVRTGVIDSMSFGFSVKKDSWSQDGQTRYLEDVTLYEVSLVSTPAYEGTAGTVSVRSAEGISADALADALLRIESGEELEPEQGALVAEVIGKLTKTPEVEEVEGDILALKQKKLALLMMGI